MGVRGPVVSDAAQQKLFEDASPVDVLDVIDVLRDGADLLEFLSRVAAEWEAKLSVPEGRSDEYASHLLDMWMTAEFQYLSFKFDTFWLEDAESASQLLRAWPEAPLFSGLDFERLVRCVFYLTEFKLFHLTSRSHDGGIDLLRDDVIDTPDLLAEGIKSYRTLVQCKLYPGQVPINFLREFMGVIAVADGLSFGRFVTTGLLTVSGVDFIRQAHRKFGAGRIAMVGRERFEDLMALALATIERFGWDDEARDNRPRTDCLMVRETGAAYSAGVDRSDREATATTARAIWLEDPGVDEDRSHVVASTWP